MDEKMLSSLDYNYLDASRIFMAYSATGEYLERKSAAIASCGLPVQDFNWGFLKPPYEDLDSTAAQVRSYFIERNLPFRLTSRGLEDRWLQKLESSGWHRAGDPTPGMALGMPGSFPRPRAPFRIHEVRSPEQLVAFREAAFQGFGYPVAAAHIFLNERLLGLPQVRLYSGWLNGNVVATSMMVATGTVAGIYWVATIESQRGRGYGEALTWAAIGGGREFGCTIASLQASKMGRPVYERMKFEHVLDYEHLLPSSP